MICTEMVWNFRLQGIAGSLYAAHDGEPQAVARRSNPITCPDLRVISYPALPKPLPLRSPTVSIPWWGFSALANPTGSKDPLCVTPRFARCHSNLIERSQPLPLNELLRYAFEQHTAELAPDTVETVLHYILERLGNWYDDAGSIFLLSEQCSRRGHRSI